MAVRHLDDETTEQIRKGFAGGLTLAELAAIIGVTDRTLYRWFHEGEIATREWDEAEDQEAYEAEEPDNSRSYRRLFQVCHRARAVGTGLLLATAEGAAMRAAQQGNDARQALRIVEMRRCNHKMVDPDEGTGAGITVVFVCPDRNTDDPGDSLTPALDDESSGGNGSAGK